MKKNQDPIICQIDFDGKDIFEVGCGYGKFTLEHFQHANSVFGIDTRRQLHILRKAGRFPEETGSSFFKKEISSTYAFKERNLISSYSPIPFDEFVAMT